MTSSNSKISHIGIAVSDLNQAIEKYTLLLGSQPNLVSDVADQNVKVAIFSGDNSEHVGGRIELVAPSNDQSPIKKFIDKKGEGLHHICVYVDNIEESLKDLEMAGVELIDHSPRIGAEGNKIAFVHPKDCHGVLIELEERSA